MLEPDGTANVWVIELSPLVGLVNPTNYIIGVQKGGSGATTYYDGTPHSAGETVFLVGKYDFTASPNFVTLWINPDPATFGAGSEPFSVLQNSAGVDGYTIDRFNMRQNTITSVPAAMQWDELRFGYSWADVTPSAPPPVITVTDLKWLGSGGFQFAYSNYTTQSFTVYLSTNLTAWSPLGTATQTLPGYFQFTDTAATNSPSRFYQLRSP